MAVSSIDYVHLTRLCEYTRELHRLHRDGGGDEAIDREFNAICRAIWGYTLDDFDDDCLSVRDHAWLDNLTRARACRFAARNGYDLADYVHGGCVTDWWGFVWMILAEKRGLLTPERRAAAWARYEAKLRQEGNVAGVIYGRGPGTRPASPVQGRILDHPAHQLLEWDPDMGGELGDE